MEKNCELSRLFGSVNNDNNLYFGEMSFTVDDKDGTHDPSLQVKSGSDMTIETVSGTFKDGTTKKDYTAGRIVTFNTTRGAVVKLYPGYELISFKSGYYGAYTLNTEIFKYEAKLEEVQILGLADGLISGKLSDFSNSANTLKSLHIGGNNNKRQFVIDNAPVMSILETLNVFNSATNLIETSQFAAKFPSLKAIYSVIVTGNISDFAYMIQNGMTALRLENSLNNLTGNLSSLIGATNCEITLPATKTVETTQATLDTLIAAGCTVTNYKLIE